MRALVLVNPRARRLRRGRLAADQVQAILGHVGDVVLTKDLRHVEEVLTRELDGTVACIVTVGGDGALHWAVNLARPIADARGLPLPAFLPARSGTIDFVARKVGLRGGPDAILARLAARLRAGLPLPSASLPTARVQLEPSDGEPRDALAFAGALGGIGLRFFDQYYAEPDPSPATIVKLIARAVAGLPVGTEASRAMFQTHDAEVRVDGELVPVRSHAALHFGSIPIDLGGVLRVFPYATREALHVQAGQLSPREIVESLPALVRGGGLRGPLLVDRGATSMEVHAREPLRPILDGERYPATRSLLVTRGPEIDVVVV